MLKRRLGQYENVIFINPGQVVSDLKVTITIKESRRISVLQIPKIDVGLLSGNLIKETTFHSHVQDRISGVSLYREDDNKAIVAFQPDESLQLSGSENGISEQFVVQYDVDRDTDYGDLAVSILVHFVHRYPPSPCPAS